VQEDARMRPIDIPAGPCDHFNLIAVPASRRNRLTRLELTD
jgi:hypothetical protein